MNEASSVPATSVHPAPPQISWRRRVWHWATLPWFSSLLAQPVMCRVLLATVAILGGAHLMGWSLWPCVFASSTGLPCPGCGMTRATAALLQGRWGLAINYHPFSPGFLAMAALVTWTALTPKPWSDPVVRWVKAVESRTLLPLLFLVCAFMYGLIRMAAPSTNPPIVSPAPVRAWLQERINERPQ
jgi:hypothetical protein